MLDLVRSVPNQAIAGSDGYPVIYISTSFTPPKWKDTNTLLKAIYYQRSLEEIGTTYTLTLNISPDLTKKALDNGFKIVRKRIAQSLKRYFKRHVDFWIMLETSVKDNNNNYNFRIGRPHIHGSIQIHTSEEKLLKSALRSINGVTSTVFKQHEARIKQIDKVSGGGDGWARYVTKHYGYTRLFMPDGNIITRTQKTAKYAQRLYEKDRQAIIKSAKKAKQG